MNDEAKTLRASGGSEDDVYRMRAAATSPEAANRLADLDRKKPRGSRASPTHLQQRAALLSGPQADAHIAQWRTQLLTPEEQRRLRAYQE